MTKQTARNRKSSLTDKENHSSHGGGGNSNNTNNNNSSSSSTSSSGGGGGGGNSGERRGGGHKGGSTKHVPCKFFKHGNCTAGANCDFSHDPNAYVERSVCNYFVKGNCKYGNKCALSHTLTDPQKNGAHSLLQNQQQSLQHHATSLSSIVRGGNNINGNGHHHHHSRAFNANNRGPSANPAHNNAVSSAAAASSAANTTPTAIVTAGTAVPAMSVASHSHHPSPSLIAGSPSPPPPSSLSHKPHHASAIAHGYRISSSMRTIAPIHRDEPSGMAHSIARGPGLGRNLLTTTDIASAPDSTLPSENDAASVAMGRGDGNNNNNNIITTTAITDGSGSTTATVGPMTISRSPNAVRSGLTSHSPFASGSIPLLDQFHLSSSNNPPFCSTYHQHHALALSPRNDRFHFEKLSARDRTTSDDIYSRSMPQSKLVGGGNSNRMLGENMSLSMLISLEQQQQRQHQPKDTEDESLGGFLPSSLNDLMTPNEIAVRRSRSNSHASVIGSLGNNYQNIHGSIASRVLSRPRDGLSALRAINNPTIPKPQPAADVFDGFLSLPNERASEFTLWGDGSGGPEPATGSARGLGVVPPASSLLSSLLGQSGGGGVGDGAYPSASISSAFVPSSLGAVNSNGNNHGSGGIEGLPTSPCVKGQSPKCPIGPSVSSTILSDRHDSSSYDKTALNPSLSNQQPVVADADGDIFTFEDDFVEVGMRNLKLSNDSDNDNFSHLSQSSPPLGYNADRGGMLCTASALLASTAMPKHGPAPAVNPSVVHMPTQPRGSAFEAMQPTSPTILSHQQRQASTYYRHRHPHSAATGYTGVSQ